MSKKITFKFAPGQKVEDMLTGVQGIVSANVVLIEGYQQVQIQPKSDTGKDIPDGWLVDDVQLKLIEGGLDVPKVYEVEFKYNVGDKVKDTVLGLVGIITKAVYYLNGCIHYKVQPKIGEDLKIPEPLMVNEKLLEILEPIESYEPAKEEPITRGPSTRVTHSKI